MTMMTIAKSAPMPKNTINATATCSHRHGVDWVNVGDWVNIGDWVNVEHGVNVGHLHVVDLFVISV